MRIKEVDDSIFVSLTEIENIHLSCSKKEELLDPAPHILHCHLHPELHICLSGHGLYFIDGENYEFEKDCIVIIDPYQIHRFVNRSEITSMAHIGFNKEMKYFQEPINEFWERLKELHLIKIPNVESGYLSIITEKLIEENEKKNEYWQELCSSLLVNLLVLCDRYREHKIIPLEGLIKGVAEYIDNHFSEKLTLEFIADKFNVSKYHLSREFHKCSGVGFKEYLTQRRLAAACELLKTTNDNILNICFDIGFNSLSVFNRAFKMFYGLSPKSFRKL